MYTCTVHTDAFPPSTSILCKQYLGHRFTWCTFIHTYVRCFCKKAANTWILGQFRDLSFSRKRFFSSHATLYVTICSKLCSENFFFLLFFCKHKIYHFLREWENNHFCFCPIINPKKLGQKRANFGAFLYKTNLLRVNFLPWMLIKNSIICFCDFARQIQQEPHVHFFIICAMELN